LGFRKSIPIIYILGYLSKYLFLKTVSGEKAFANIPFCKGLGILF